MGTTPNTFWDLFAGYTVLWFLIAVFAVRLMREQSSLSRKVNELKCAVSGGGAKQQVSGEGKVPQVG